MTRHPIAADGSLDFPPADTAPAPVSFAEWHRAATDAPPAPVLPPDASLLVIAAHPDDEAIGAGRLLADHRGLVRCVTLTAGEHCHGEDADAGQVSRLRLREWAEALAVLGAEPVETTRWPDGGLSGHEDEATEALAGLATGVDFLLAPWQHDPHPDHEAAGRIGASLARRTGLPLWAYLVWTPYWLTPEDLARRGAGLLTHPTSERAERLWREALDCHHSQLTAQPPASHPVVPAALLDRHDRQLLIRETHACHA
ncbi:PIG-L deacetylase family protein [Microbacterium sp. A93]|uniref:PIG-L deacetylase family protein n=1 Tax=Microbacterium sp. A93 TaxID=3450716 RepID=UPI003F422E51